MSVCVCVRHHESCHYVQRSVQAKVPTESAQSGKHFKYGVFSKNALFKSYGVKKPTSFVCAYRDIIWCRWSDILPEISKTGPFLILSKSNGRLQATWQRATSLSAVQQLLSSVYFPLHVCYRVRFLRASRTRNSLLAPRVCTLVLFIWPCICT